MNVNVNSVIDMLQKRYPDVKCELQYSTPFELMVATILSAQCTDVRVNIITSDLFEIYSEPCEFAQVEPAKLEELIKSCGFYKNKAKNIIGAANMIVHTYGGKVPDTMDELLRLPGVGRKTANVILSNAFSKDAIAVDTHVFRVSRRIGLATADNPDGVERQLMEIIPKEKWSLAHHLLIFHGRRTCKARKPLCDECTIQVECKYYNSVYGGKS